MQAIAKIPEVCADPVFTTLEKIRTFCPCASGWGKLLNFLGKTSADDEPLRFSTILESNGLSDALWCLRTVADTQPERFRLYLGCIVERVAPIWEKWAKDNRPQDLHLIREIANELKAGNKPAAAAADAAWRAAADAAWRAAAVAWRAADAAAVADAAAAVAWRAAAADAAAVADADADAAAAADAAEREFQRKLLIQVFG